MKCEFCGTDLKEGDKFCNACGAPCEETVGVKEEDIFKDNTNVEGVNTTVIDSTNTTEEVSKPTPEVAQTPAPTPVPTTMNAEPKKGLAIASLIIGIICLLGGGLTIVLPIIGLVLGICNKDKCGQKTAGIITNVLALVFGIIIYVMFGFLATIFVSTVENMDQDELDTIRHQIEGVVNEPDPFEVEGEWLVNNVTEGYVFSGNEFYWYKNLEDKTDNYWYGTFESGSAKDKEEYSEFVSTIIGNLNGEVNVNDFYFVKLTPTKVISEGEDKTENNLPEGSVWDQVWLKYNVNSIPANNEVFEVYNLIENTAQTFIRNN